MKIYFDSWWSQNHLAFQGITDEQAKQIWSTAQKAANQNQPCEWCNATSAKIDSLENQLELAVDHAHEADENAPWLTTAHILCTDVGIPQGHIGERLNKLADHFLSATKMVAKE